MSILKDSKLSLGVLFLRKNKFIRRIFFIGVIGITLASLIRINILNTKALSPLGNTNDNYKLVSEEFGEDFANFIQDKSPVKIYLEKDEQTMVRLGDKDFVIKSESNVVGFFKGIFYDFKSLFN